MKFLLLPMLMTLNAAPLPIVWIGGTEIPVPNAPAGYESLHYGTRFSTKLAVPDGLYRVTFSFIETSQQGAADAARLFDVLINDQPVLVGLDVFARAGYMTPLRRAVLVAVVDGKMTIDFKATMRSAIVSGIEIEPLTNLLLNLN